MKSLSQERKAHLSKIMNTKWRKAAKYAAILGRPKEEVFKNLDIIDKYSKQIEDKIPHYLDLVWKEGKWSKPYDVSFFEKWKEENKKQTDADIKNHNEEIQRRNKEKFEREKAEYLGIKYYSKKDEERSPMENLKVMLWAINTIGDIEKAEKIFLAAKLAMEAMKN